MSRINESFRRLAAEKRSAFIPFIMAGDPDLRATAALAVAAARAGADALEIGVPFSDPMADGPVLQRAAERSLKNGVNLAAVLGLLRDMRRDLEIPVILFGYRNPIHKYGDGRFVRDARRAGVDGVLCVDLPPEEAGELKLAADRADLDLIFLLAPTTSEERARSIIQAGRGFLYLVSVTGVTGSTIKVGRGLERMVGRIKSLTDLPVGVGFGIGSPEQAARVARFADAVICGSAVMKLVEANAANRRRMIAELARFFRSMAAAVRGARSRRASGRCASGPRR